MAEANEVVTDRTLDEGLDETLRATLADINGREDEPQAGEGATPAAESSPVEAPAETRARDDAGKFVAKPKESAPAPVAADTTPVDGQTEVPVADSPTINGKPLDINRPPASWKPAAKAAWAALPPQVRQEIYRREGDFHNGNSSIRDNADFGQRIKNMAQPYDMLINAEGATHEAVFDDYLKSNAMLRVGTPEQKLNLIKELDRRFNCGLNQDFSRAVMAEVARITGQPAQAQQQPQQFHDPRVDQLLQSQQQEEQRRAQESQRQSDDAVARFRSAADEGGQPKYPFIDNVENDLIARIPEIRRSNPSLSHYDILEKAYDLAVWANPETRAVLIGQQAAKANQPAETRLKVEAARRANAVNVPRRGAIPASQPVANLVLGSPESDEAMRETYRELMSQT